MGKREKKCDNGVFRQDPSVFPPIQLSGQFSLECGSDEYKIFESNEPTEMDLSIALSSSLCELDIRVEVENGPDLLFNLPSQQNGFAFYGKSVRRVIVQCQNGLGNVCRGVYNIAIILRNSKYSSVCPVSYVSNNFLFFNLDCGESTKIFESDAATEAGISITLNIGSSDQLCNLTVNAELDDNTTLSFFLPNPNQPFATDFNSISFYSKILRRVTLECESSGGVGCSGRINKYTVLRK